MIKIAGLFEQEQAADLVIDELQNAGFNQEQFGVLARNRVIQKVDWEEDVEEGVIHQEGSKLGASGGATVGGLTGLLLGVGALAIPGIGPALAAGSIATALGTIAAATGLGAVSGGLLGALTSMGISEEDADFYAEGVKRGGILVVVEADDERADFVRTVMKQAGAVDISARRKVWQADGWSGFDDTIVPDDTYPNLQL